MAALLRQLVGLTKSLPSPLRENVGMKLFTMAYVPLIASCRPKVLQVSDGAALVQMPLRRRTRNHLNSMYFGAFAIGGDITGGVLAMHMCIEQDAVLVPSFKDVHIDFLRRAERDVFFSTRDADGSIREAIRHAAATGERVNVPMTIDAHVHEPEKELVAEIALTLSLKSPK